MKFILLTLLSLTSLSSFASSLADDLIAKDCSIVAKKSIRIGRDSLYTDIGDVSIVSFLHEKSFKIKARQTLPIIDTNKGALVTHVGKNIILVCILENDECLSNLDNIQTSQVYELSNRNIEIKCK